MVRVTQHACVGGEERLGVSCHFFTSSIKLPSSEKQFEGLHYQLFGPRQLCAGLGCARD